MGKTTKRISRIRKKKVKEALKKTNGDAKNSLLQAGYSKATAHNSTTNTVVKICQQEILEELKEKDITIEMVINRLNQDRNLAKEKKDIATMTRCDELLGKYLAMFKDKQILTDEYDESEFYKSLFPNRLDSN